MDSKNISINLIVSYCLSKYPKFKKIYCKFPEEVVVLGNKLINYLEELSNKLIEEDDDQLVMLEDYFLNGDDNEDRNKLKLRDLNLDPDYCVEEEKIGARKLLEDRYSFDKMLHFVGEWRNSTKSQVRKY
jgi:hypothetical protein